MHRKLLISTIGVLLLAFSNVQAKRSVRRPSRSQRNKDLRTLVNLLDYIGKDYAHAVENGRVINRNEYAEMEEFAQQVSGLINKLNKQIENPRFNELKPSVDKLQKAIQLKADVETISKLTGGMRQKLLVMNLITVAPQQWPDLNNGSKIFAKKCQSCHGKKGFGDGPLAETLTPPPSNFHDSTLAAQLSPLQAYNTIRLGINGTAMRSFPQLSDQEVWDIAFYVNSLRYIHPVSDAEKQQIINTLKDTVDLKDLATIPNKKWFSYLKQHGTNIADGMSVLRSSDSTIVANNKQYLDQAITLLHKAFKAYQDGAIDQANSLALNAYLNGVEPVESQIKASNPSLVYKIEDQMIKVRSLIKNGAADKKLQDKIQATVSSIHEAQGILQQNQKTFMFAYLMSASILLREGLEAFLIILVILGVLKSVDANESIKYVHGGWLLALIIGIISWFFAENLLSMSSIQRELMEGIGSLVAVGLLLYIGFWLHDKTHVSHWKEFVQGKIHRLLDKNNQWGLAVLSFIVVFREAFESVIFLSSISIKSAGNSGILLGSGSAILAVIVLGFFLVKFSTKIPIRSLFKYSSVAMGLLAVILVGKGIHEFQEAGYLGISSVPLHISLPTAGVYPTLQTFLGQVLIASIIIGLWAYSNHRASLQQVN